VSILDHEPLHIDDVALVRVETMSVVVVDPHPPVRDGLSLLLAPEGLTVLGGASTGAGGEALIVRHEPDIALIAADLPDVDGVALVRRLVRRGLRSAVVLYADDADCESSAAAVHAGAAGLVAKRRSIAELAEALRSVATGGLWFEERDDDALAGPAAAAASQTAAHVDAVERRAARAGARRRGRLDRGHG
jgi:DNA-binding NarL/FixJ family response regulator